MNHKQSTAYAMELVLYPCIYLMSGVVFGAFEIAFEPSLMMT